jgi:hypothetical protein
MRPLDSKMARWMAASFDCAAKDPLLRSGCFGTLEWL